MPFNAHTVSILTDVPFLTLHVSMILFLLRRRRKESSLRNAFFTLYIIVSVGGVMANGAVRMRANADEVIHKKHYYPLVKTLLKFGVYFQTVLFIYAVSSGFLTDAFLACEVCPKLQIESCTYGRMAEALGHTAIALNRFRYSHIIAFGKRTVPCRE